jgi:hypothetical protein
MLSFFDRAQAPSSVPFTEVAAMSHRNLLDLPQAESKAAGLAMAEVIKAVDTATGEKAESRMAMPTKPRHASGRWRQLDPGRTRLHPRPETCSGTWAGGLPDKAVGGLPGLGDPLGVGRPDVGGAISVKGCAWVAARRAGGEAAGYSAGMRRPGQKQGCPMPAEPIMTANLGLLLRRRAVERGIGTWLPL